MTRLTDLEQLRAAKRLREHYEQGATVKVLAEQTGRSTRWVRWTLRQVGTDLDERRERRERRGRATREQKPSAPAGRQATAGGARSTPANAANKGRQITGEARVALRSQLRDRYEQGASIRDLMDETGRSYGWVHRVLQESGVTLRGRGGDHTRSTS